MKGIWGKLEQNPRFFTCFWGAIGSFLVWLIVEYSGGALLFLGSNTLSFLTDYIDSRYEKASILQNTTYSYFILSLIFVVVAVAWGEVSSKISYGFKKSKVKDGGKKGDPAWAPFVFLVVKLVVWFYLLMALLFLAGESIVLNASSDFKQHMRVVAPYISDQEEELLFSEWSQMESLEDYNALYEKLTPVAKEHGLRLKRNHHY